MALKDHLPQIVDLLMGAAYADKALSGKETDTVRRLLGELLGHGVLPADLDGRVRQWDPKSFALATAAVPLAKEPAETRRKLLELIAAVHDADDVLDLAEDQYLKDVAKALGVPPESIRDLALDVEVSDLGAALQLK
jgi:uncharacterized tellurite resistance protein B-like protein